MTAIFDILPGLEVRPGELSQALARMWSEPAAHGRDAPVPDEVKATQANVVLHLGFGTTTEDALETFRSAVEFSSRYPSRVVVLCPRKADQSGVDTRVKIYGECFLGKNKGDTRCCEFVILNYSFEARRFLESQVSVCLSTDLPTYYWAHRFIACSNLVDYQKLLGRCCRFVFDSSAAPADAVSYPWPEPAKVRDLANSRMLPVRQSIGQFLAGFPPERLVQGLKRVTTSFEAVHFAEGGALHRWLWERLVDCGAGAETVERKTAVLPHKGGACFTVRFEYDDARSFFWTANCDTGVAHFSADLGTGARELPSHIQMLSESQALAEAFFF